MAVWYFTADTRPDQDTTVAFRKCFVREFEASFDQILLLCHEMRVLKLDTVSLDGNKIKANASKHMAMSWKYANQLEKKSQQEVEIWQKRAEEADIDDEIALDVPTELSRQADRLTAICNAMAKN